MKMPKTIRRIAGLLIFLSLPCAFLFNPEAMANDHGQGHNGHNHYRNVDVIITADKTGDYLTGERATFDIKIAQNKHPANIKIEQVEATFPDENTPVAIDGIDRGMFRYVTGAFTAEREMTLSVTVRSYGAVESVKNLLHRKAELERKIAWFEEQLERARNHRDKRNIERLIAELREIVEKTDECIAKIRRHGVIGKASYTIKVVKAAPNTPQLYGLGTTDEDGVYTVSWSDESASGAALYDLEEDDDSGFASPVTYWAMSNCQGIVHEEEGSYYYRVKAWSAAPGEGGKSSDWSNVVTVNIDFPIDPPPEGPESGYIHGFVYNASTELPLKGAIVTADDVPGAVVTDENGKFTFPSLTGGVYKLTVTKEDFTYARRQVEVVTTRDTTVDPVYLVPRDTSVTTITTDGGTAVNSAGTVELVFPEGAVPESAGNIDVRATQYGAGRELPGPLPEASFFTYAVDFEPDGVTFDKPVTFRLKNTRGFAPGTSVPIGYFNKDKLEWEKAGMGVVDQSGQWAIFEISHFSPYDCNFPVTPPAAALDPVGSYVNNKYPAGSRTGNTGNEVKDGNENAKPDQKPADPAGWLVDYEEGSLLIEYDLPLERTLNQATGLGFAYRSEYVKPKYLIKTRTYLDEVGAPGIAPTLMPETFGYRINIEGIDKKVKFTPEAGHVVQRYLWDGKNARGELLGTGSYPYKITLSNDYIANYATATYFGGPPIADTGIPAGELKELDIIVEGRAMIVNRIASPFGAGWALKGLQSLNLDPDSTILLTEEGGKNIVFNSDPIGYVATGENKVLIMSSRYKKIIDEIKTPQISDSVLVSRKGDKAYSFYSFDNIAYMTIIDIPSNAIEETITVFTAAKNSYTRIKSTKMSQDGDRIYVSYAPNSGNTGTIAIIDTQAKQVIDTIPLNYGVGSIVLSPDELFVYVGASTGTQGNILKVNLATKEVAIWTYSNPSAPYSMTMTADGSTLYVQHAYDGSSQSGYISVMDTATGMEVKQLQEYARGKARLALTKDGKYLYASYANGNFISVMNVPDLTKDHQYNNLSGQLAFSPDGRYLYLSQDNYDIIVVDTERKEVVRRENCTTWPRLSSFTPIDPPVKVYTSDAWETSRLSRQEDGTFVRIMEDRSKTFFDAGGRQTQSTDKNGNITAYAYDADGKLTSITDPAGRTTVFAYDAKGCIESITDSALRTTRFYVDSSGDLKEIKSPDNVTDFFDYSPEHLMTSHKNGRDFVTSFEYDANACVNKVISPPKKSLDGGEIVTKSEAREFTPSITTYLVNDLSADTNAAVTHPDDIKMCFTDGLNNTTTFSGVLQGQFIEPGSDVFSQVDPLGNVTTITKDHEHKPFLIQNPNSSNTNFTYDTRGNLLTSTQTNIGATTTFAYDNDLHQLSMVKDPKNQAAYFSYNTPGNLTQIQDPDNKLTKFSYNAKGLVTKITDALNKQTLFGYDPVTGNLLSITDPLGHVSSFEYDGAGNVISYIDANGKITRYGYDVMNRMTSMQDAKGNATSYAYDTCGNLIRVEDAKGNSTEFSYDPVGQLIETRKPLDKTKRYYYDSNRNLARVVTEKGDKINFIYDAANRLVRKELPDNTVYYTYDNAGNLIAVSDNSSNMGFGYDEADRLTEVSTHAPQPESAISYKYDLNSNRTRLTYPDASYITYEYDALDRLAKIKNQSSQQIASYSYDAISRRTSKALLNGTSAAYTYDTADRLTKLVNNGLQAVTYTYSYDNVGNRLTKQDPYGTESYTYDDIYQLTNIAHPDLTNSLYNYDELGNRINAENGTAVTYEVNALNQYITVNSTAYSYDDNGSLLSDGTNTYGYDAENRLIHATSLRGSEATEAIYAYDAFGRRILKTVDGVATTFLYDGDDIIAEYDASTNITAKYIHGVSIDEPICMMTPSSGGFNLRYYRYDGLGSVTALTDSTGAVIESYTYDAFGKPNAPSAIGNPYMFTGREYDAETGLYHYRERAYSPVIGRFLQTDPLQIDDENTYTYCYNNPVNLIDPYGLYVAVGPVAIPGTGGGVLIHEGGLQPKKEKDVDSTFTDVTRHYAENTKDKAGEVKNDQPNPDKDKLKGGKKGKRDKELKGFPDKFKKWFHKEWKKPGDPDASYNEIKDAYEVWKRIGGK